MDQERASEIKFFDAGSRIGRTRYLAYLMGLVLMLVLPVVVAASLMYALHMVLLGVLLMLAIEVFAVVMTFVFIVRRLHDMGWSGWWSLIYAGLCLWSFAARFQQILSHGLAASFGSSTTLLPSLAQLVFFLVLVSVPGSKADNRFGLAPPPNTKWVIAGAWAWSAMVILVLIVGFVFGLYRGLTSHLQTAEAIALAKKAEVAAAAAHSSHQTWPADLGTLYGSNPVGRYVESIDGERLSDNGFDIVVRLRTDDVSSVLAGRTIELWTHDGGKTWHCGPGGSDPVAGPYLPNDCRDTEAP